MKDLFEILSVQEVKRVRNNLSFTVGLRAIGYKPFAFGQMLDGDNYNEHCFIARMSTKQNANNEIFYLTSEGEQVHYKKVDDEFKDYIFKLFDISSKIN